MFYLKKNKLSAGSSQINTKLQFEGVGENKNDILDTKLIYNFKVENGNLVDGYGVRELALPRSLTNSTEYVVQTGATEILDVWTYNWFTDDGETIEEFIFYLDSTMSMYMVAGTNKDILPISIDVDSFTEIPKAFKAVIDNDDCFVIMSSKDPMVVLSRYHTKTYANAPKIMDCCVHYDKIFAIVAGDRNSLIWSENQDLTTWTSQDKNKLRFDDERGMLSKIVSFNDNLYLFREFGITKLSIYSTNSEFSIDHCYLSSSYIYPNSITVCGEKVVFLTRDGLYSFDGNTTKKLDCILIDKVEKELTSKPLAVCYQGKYFLACRFSFDDVYRCETNCVNNVILVIDCNSMDVEIIRGIDVKSFAVLKSSLYSKLLMCFRGEDKAKIGELTYDGKFFGTVSQKSWIGEISNYGYMKNIKKLEEINLSSKKKCSLIIKTEKGSATYNVNGMDYPQRLKTNSYGKNLQISFLATESGQKISIPEITYTIYK